MKVLHDPAEDRREREQKYQLKVFLGKEGNPFPFGKGGKALFLLEGGGKLKETQVRTLLFSAKKEVR